MKIRDTIGEFEATVGTKMHPDNAAMAIALYQREIEQLKAERNELLEIVEGCHICTGALARAASQETEPPAKGGGKHP